MRVRIPLATPFLPIGRASFLLFLKAVAGQVFSISASSFRIPIQRTNDRRNLFRCMIVPHSNMLLKSSTQAFTSSCDGFVRWPATDFQLRYFLVFLIFQQAVGFFLGSIHSNVSPHRQVPIRWRWMRVNTTSSASRKNFRRALEIKATGEFHAKPGRFLWSESVTILAKS